MARFETADMIARTRMVTAHALLDGQADLSQYPFQLLSIVAVRGIGGERLSAATAAADYLMQFGWDAVSIAALNQQGEIVALMRRRPPA